MLGIKWYQFVWNDDVRRLTKQPKLTAIMQEGSCVDLLCLGTLRALMITLMPTGEDITWLRTIQQDLRHHHLMLPEAADLA